MSNAELSRPQTEDLIGAAAGGDERAWKGGQIENATTYGHVIDELDEEPRLAAEDAIRRARQISRVREVPGDGDATQAG